MLTKATVLQIEGTVHPIHVQKIKLEHETPSFHGATS